MVESQDTLRVGPQPFDGKFGLIKLGYADAAPYLKVEFQLRNSAEGDYFKVESSAFGLFVPSEKRSGEVTHLPVVRVEYERDQVPAAHVHFHTTSAVLGWIYGVAGGPYRRSETLHFPVGSKRFRPTIEDFLLFLDRERLFRGWRDSSDWKRQAKERLAVYEATQAAAIVKHHQLAVATELGRLGWAVAPPPTVAS